MTHYFKLLLLLLLFTACEPETTKKKPKTALRTYSSDITKFPDPLGFTSDFESILTTAQVAELDSICKAFRDATTNEIAIVTVDSIHPYKNIRDFSVDLGNYWSVGDNEKNNGLLIVVSKNLREMRIATGYDTEKILTDPILKEIIDTEMIPHFKNGNYFEGIRAGLLGCIEKWK